MLTQNEMELKLGIHFKQQKKKYDSLATTADLDQVYVVN
jgi:hypothetical protein